MNIFLRLLEKRAKSVNDIVLIDSKSGKEISAEELLDSAYNMAEKLYSLGITRNDYIVLSLPPSLEYYSVLYGCFALGAIPSLVDVKQKKENLVTCIDELKPSLWISTKDIPDFSTITPENLLQQSSVKIPKIEISSNTTCMLLYTTGTTGVPKGVPWTVGQLESQAIELNAFHKQINTEFVIFPYLALACIYNNRTAIIPHTRTTQPNLMPIESILSQMKTHGCDYIFASPAFWARVISHLNRTQEKLEFIKIISTAGASLNLIMLQKLDDLLPNGEIYIPYASTEALLPITQIQFTDFKELSRNRTIINAGVPLGKSCNGINIQVIGRDDESALPKPLPANTVGELVVSGSRITNEYFRRSDITLKSKTKLNGSDFVWHKMGDLGYIDENGMAWFMTRKKYAVNTPNKIFYPDALEQCLNIHGNLISSAVIYMEDTDLVCVVIPETEREHTNELSLKEKLKEVGYMKSQVYFYPSLLPSDNRHNSKINRNILKQWISSKSNVFTCEDTL
ncbi:peptide synthase [Agarivorans sp. Toyoura001]|uniref:AMP-binding protein n=1 Tax=Agarivorans sp. Toyoura001 TaxID=2283141 RepID=UPI0010D880A7|nr:AMP-binding protein [Agarivorans sp. Toyoura001]GDY27864.1 peptide synthase [Agarivorans sp. Toyoura001]